jgi:hypothetical protein
MAEALGWRWEFGIQIPFLVLCMVISQLSIPDQLGLQDTNKTTVWQALAEFDTKGSVLLTFSISFLILGLGFGGNVLPWLHPLVVASLCIFAAGFPIFLWTQSRAEKPIMPLDLVTKPPRANLILGNAIASFISSSIYFNIPVYFQAVLLNSATASGLSLVFPTLVASIMGAITGFTISWTRRLKWSVLSGTIFYIIGTLSLVALRRGLPDVLYSLALVPFSLGQGQQFPGTVMCVLALSTQAEQAVVVSTLGLWRSLGNMVGIAVCSLILQNALVYYLHLYVQGSDKQEIIDRVRASIEAIAELEQPYREQVVRSYEASLRLVFTFCVGIAIVSMFLILPTRIPRLGQKKH